MIHPTAEVEPGSRISKNCTIWHQAQVRKGAVLAPGCVLGKGAYVDAHVVLGSECRVQNYGCVFGPAKIGKRVIIGPHAVIANCRFPRVSTLSCQTGYKDDPVVIGNDVGIGAHAVILPGIRIGDFAIIGSGAVVTHNVPPHTLVYGIPARVVGRVCRCGRPVVDGITCRCRSSK